MLKYLILAREINKLEYLGDYDTISLGWLRSRVSSWSSDLFNNVSGHEMESNKLGDVIVGEGSLQGKGVYANRNFQEGEIVIKYNLTPLTKNQFAALPEEEKVFTHMHHGSIHLYSTPERYVNHSPTPNTRQDFEKWCDVALRDIKKGEMITTDATKDDI